MAFIGEVNVTLFWGTKYDSINVPLHSEQIVQEATKTITRTAVIVWQTTWLSQIRINIDNYDEIVGVQYARLSDSRAHWFDVLDYQQVSQGCVELGLRYDTLLSIPLSTWNECSGILRRWSVDNDSPYQYINSSEPIDLVDPPSLSWQIIRTVKTGINMMVVGAPYDMANPPEVVRYTNPSGETTNVYFPSLTPPNGKATVFLSGLNPAGASDAVNFDDGMCYYVWANNSRPVKTYNSAISLGVDMVINAYILPERGWFQSDIDADGRYNILSGTQQIVNGELPLYISNVNNAKAGAINTTLTLASAMSGDSVVVNNYQLQDGRVFIYSDPYSTGGFRARFFTYLNEFIGTAGWVKSPGWQPLTITSGVGFGVAANAISNTMSADTLNLSNNQTQWAASYNVMQTERAGLHSSMIGDLSTGVSQIGALASAFDINNSNIASLVTAPLNNALNQQDLLFKTNQQIRQIQLAAEQQAAKAEHQRQMLAYQGNAGRLAPPNVKYNIARDITNLTYAFTVMCARPSLNDIKRMDNFFTAYGYNVDGLLLTSPDQLHTREKFTFVQADDVRVLSTIYSDDNERIGDEQTTADIQRRFSAGLRIWRSSPNYDYSLPNPIGGS